MFRRCWTVLAARPGQRPGRLHEHHAVKGRASDSSAFISNYRSSPSLQNYQPLTPGEKFRMASDDSLDRGTFVLAAIYAVQSQWTKANHSFGQGAAGFGRERVVTASIGSRPHPSGHTAIQAACNSTIRKSPETRPPSSAFKSASKQRRLSSMNVGTIWNERRLRRRKK